MLTAVGAGCEGTVSAGTLPDGRAAVVKRYRRRTELERHLVGAALLAAALRAQERTHLVRLPQIVGFDLTERTVVSVPYVREPAVLPVPLIRAKARARAAVVCAAGLAAALPVDEVRLLVVARYGAADLSRCWFEGVDLNDTGLRTDGRSWFLVDF